MQEQGEKLENISKRCDGIDANLITAQQNLNKLGSVFGGIKNYFNPPKSAFPKSVSQPQINQKKTTTSNIPRATNPKDDTDTYFGKPRSAMDDIERETEDGLRKFLDFLSILILSLDILDDIHLGVARLKGLAQNLNDELTRQDPMISNLGVKIENLNGTVKNQNKTMNQQLRR